MPALELDGRTIWESGAITEVLCERFPATGMGRAPDDPERIDWLIWVHFAETLSQHIATLTQQHIVLREDHMRSPVLMNIEARRAEKCFAAIDARLAGRDYLLDGGFSAADVSVGQAVYMARHFVRTEEFSGAAGLVRPDHGATGLHRESADRGCRPSLHAGLLRTVGGDMNFRTKIRAVRKFVRIFGTASRGEVGSR